MTVDELDARMKQLETQQSLQTDALMRILMGNWTQSMPHAAADVVALLGGEQQADAAGFRPIPFDAGA